MTKEELAALQADSKALREETARITRELDDARRRGDWDAVRQGIEKMEPLTKRQGELMDRIMEAFVATRRPVGRSPTRR